MRRIRRRQAGRQTGGALFCPKDTCPGIFNIDGKILRSGGKGLIPEKLFEGVVLLRCPDCSRSYVLLCLNISLLVGFLYRYLLRGILPGDHSTLRTGRQAHKENTAKPGDMFAHTSSRQKKGYQRVPAYSLVDLEAR